MCKLRYYNAHFNIRLMESGLGVEGGLAAFKEKIFRTLRVRVFHSKAVQHHRLDRLLRIRYQQQRYIHGERMFCISF